MALPDSELRIRSVKLKGFSPFPAWNGTISAPLYNKHRLCGLLDANGELVILQTFEQDDKCDLSDRFLRLVKVLPPPAKRVSRFCQCWTNDGSVIVTSHDRLVIFYASDDFRVLTSVTLCDTVMSLDMIKLQTGASKPNDMAFLLLIGTAFGAFLYTVLLLDKDNALGDETRDLTWTPVASVYDGVAVCMVKFSPNGLTAAIGTMDGRLFLRRLESHANDTLIRFGTEVLSRVLQAPRITGLCFSLCSTKLVVATRKGNVYVFTCASKTEQWQALPSCFDLDAVGTNKTASAVQTLLSCWGPVFVVCSRAHASRLEMYDFVSGSLLHSLQLAPTTPVSSAALSQWVDQQLVTGICSVQINDSGRSQLLCHDSSANVAVVEWPFLDIIARQ